MKRLIAIGILVMLLLPTEAALHTHIFEIGARAGLSQLTYTSNFGQALPGLNTGVDIAYLYLSPYHIGLRAGASIELSQSNFKSTNYTDQYTCTDVEGDQMQVGYSIAKYEEQHTCGMLSIPLQLALDFKGVRFLIGPQVKLPITPISYSTTAHDATLSCYFPVYDNLIENSEALSAGRIAKQQIRGKLPYAPTLWYGLSAEIGYALRLSQHNHIYLGLYGEYMINNQQCTKTDNLSVIYLTDTRDGIPVERILNSALLSNHHMSGQQVITQFGYFSAGVKISWQLARQKNRLTHKHQECKCLKW